VAETVDRKIRPYYSISCVIRHEEGDVDLTSNLVSVSIISSVNAPYQSVITSFIVDSQILVRKDLFGKYDMSLEIQLMTEEVAPTESFKLELITVRQDVPMSLKSMSEQGVQAQEILTVVNVVKNPYIQMSTTVNRLFDESHRKTPIEMVQDVVTNFLPDTNTNIITNNNNTERIFQFIIPSMTFIDAIKYIDGSDPNIVEKYGPGVGIFNGPMFFTNRFELDGSNTFCLWDLGKISSGSVEYKVYQLSLGGKDNEIMEEAGVKEDIFYTRNSVNHIYRGNQDIIYHNYINKFVSKPSNNLYEIVDVSMEDIFENSVHDGGDLNINEVLENVYTYRTIGEVGLETSDSPYVARLSRKISSLSEIEIYIDRNLALNKLSRVGIPLEFIPQSEDYVDIGGRYVVNSSKINFTREADAWVCKVRIRSARGNLKKIV